MPDQSGLISVAVCSQYAWAASLYRLCCLETADVQADTASRGQNAQHPLHCPLGMPVKRAGPSTSAGAPSPKRRVLEARDPAVETVRTSIKEAFEAYKQLVASAEGDPAEAAYQKLCDLSQGRTSTKHSFPGCQRLIGAGMSSAALLMAMLNHRLHCNSNSG